MSFNRYKKNYVLLFIGNREFVNIAIKHNKCRLKVQSLFAKQKDKINSVIVKNVGLHIIK